MWSAAKESSSQYGSCSEAFSPGSVDVNGSGSGGVCQRNGRSDLWQQSQGKQTPSQRCAVMVPISGWQFNVAALVGAINLLE